MALLAAEVVECLRQYGKLPTSLDFIPTRPLSELSGRPFRLEKIVEGFRIVRDKDAENDLSVAYTVRINAR